MKIKSFFLDTNSVKATENIHCINTFIDTKQKHKNYYAGLKYIISDPNLSIIKKKTANIESKILLHFGATDDKRLNIKIINFLISFKKKFSLEIILGPGLDYDKNKIYEMIKEIKFKCKIYNYPKNLNKIYNNSNIVITSGGNTLFNFCSLGKKNISISTNKLEIGSCKKMENLKLTNYAGHYNSITKKIFLNLLVNLFSKRNNKIKFLRLNGIVEIKNIIN